MDPEYVESVWWSLKQIFDKGLLVQDYRVAPWCPRDQHRPVRPRAGAGLRDGRRPVGLRALPADLRPAGRARPRCWCGRPPRGRWSPTPPSPCTPTSPTSSPPTAPSSWSSPSRCSARRSARGGPRPGRPSPAARWSAGPTSARSTYVDIPDAHYVVNAEYVTTEDGTGLVHQSPAFGEDDLKTCRAYGLPVVNPVRPDGTFEPDVAAGRRGVLQEGRRGAGRRPRPPPGRCSGTCRTSTATRTAGAATPRCSTTRSRPGTSAPPRSRTPCCGRTSAPTGTRRPSSTAATATG